MDVKKVSENITEKVSAAGTKAEEAIRNATDKVGEKHGAPKCCPACGSSNWNLIETDTNKFSLGKAFLGTLVLGPIGLGVGALGKQKERWFCSDCKYSAEYAKLNANFTDVSL